jgi:integrase/recombinase XerC/integrase/recombinase XerD
VRLADAVRIYLATITVPNTRMTYAAALDQLVADFGADTDVALLDAEPDRVSGWFTFVWGGKSAKTFNIRLTALASACGYWREQDWLAGDPLVRLRARPAPPDTSKALSRDRVTEILGSDAALRDRVLWHMLYESSARAEEVLMLDVPDLDTVNRCAVVTRKGGARETKWAALPKKNSVFCVTLRLGANSPHTRRIDEPDHGFPRSATRLIHYSFTLCSLIVTKLQPGPEQT